MAGSKPKSVSSSATSVSAKIDPKDPRHQLVDFENPTSLLRLAPLRMRPIIEDVYRKLPKLVMQPESRIRVYCAPDERDERLRLAFWDEYNRCAACRPPREMSVAAIVKNISSNQVFDAIYTRDRHKALWLMTPPKSYATSMRRILDMGMDKLLEVMTHPLTNSKGELDHKLINSIIKIVQITDMRVKGAIPQLLKLDQRSVNHNINHDSPASHPAHNHTRALSPGETLRDLLALPIDQLEDLDAKVDMLAYRASLLPNPDGIDITQPKGYELNRAPASFDEPFHTIDLGDPPDGDPPDGDDSGFDYPDTIDPFEPDNG